jgi:hypothetical protein
MNAALVAYRTLVELARADGEVSDEERSLLERYSEDDDPRRSRRRHFQRS